jgi:preprotein translocase subunit SecA
MRRSKQECTLTKHGLSFAIVDEIDSILIDESRTPLIISGPVEQSGDIYILSKDIVRTFTEEDFEIEEKHKSVYITDTGYQKIDAFLQKVGVLKLEESLYSGHDFHTQARNNHIMHGVTQALKASKTMKDNVDYILRNGEILIVDEFTGRIMDGRRYSDGLHQAIEAKHGVEIQQETQTLASITYQNYFRMYEKLSGMTGTASTEVHEFHEIYNLSVVSIPTHRNLQRIDEGDKIYRTEDEKFQAILELVKEIHTKGQPVLIGTASVGKSEKLSALFTKNKLEHNVLNAKNHEQEAQIIADAGKFGAITIATNMAGRGTDIILGGSLEKKIIKASRYIQDLDEKQKIVEKVREEHKHESEKVKNVGGLFVIGSERHESRRIDNQLRGRSGRQGDIGHSQFFLSLEDDLLRIFGGDKLKSLLGTFGFKEGESIEHPWLNSVISRSQSKIEAHHFEIRKNLIKYDDIMNTQRKIVYKKRMDLIDNTKPTSDIINAIFVSFIEKSTKPSLANPVVDEITESLKDYDGSLLGKLQEMWKAKYLAEENKYRARHTAIAILDSMWKEHLYNVDSLKSNMHLRSYAQKDPLSEYKIEVFEAFEQMTANYNAYLIKELIS